MRDKILKMLLQNRDEYVSGESMAQQLGISRAAIWKHIDMLKKHGCEIESKPNRGYRLKSLPDAIAPEIIRSVDFAGSVRELDLCYYDEVGSTNDIAMELAMKGAKDGTVVLAESQSKGRGRMARAWYAPNKEGVYLSIILKPEIAPQDAPKISIIAALAVARTLSAQTEAKVGVKWPNDVLAGAMKLCGILTEMTADLDRIKYIVCGIGVNVNQTSFPPELERIATSMRIQGGREYSRPQVIAQLLSEFYDIYYKYIETGDFTPMITEYTRLSVVLNQMVDIRYGGTTERGKCIGFDKDGNIVLELANGKRKRYVAGEVSIRSESTYV